MQRHIEYLGRSIYLAAVPEQGRWGYRIDDGLPHLLQEIRNPMPEEELLVEAEAAGKADVDRQRQRSARSKAAAS